jgi:hypothetical protein
LWAAGSSGFWEFGRARHDRLHHCGICWSGDFGLDFPVTEKSLIVEVNRHWPSEIHVVSEKQPPERRPRLLSNPIAEASVAPGPTSVHTPTTTLKNAALFALIGTILMTALLVWNFVLTFLNVLRDLVPAVALFQSFIYAVGCFTVMVFFFVFHRAQQ